MPNLRRPLLAATLTIVASLAVASSVSAEPGKGADVVRQHECFPDDPGGIYCIDAKYVQKETTTPSGNVSYHANGQATETFTGEGRLEGCNSSTTTKLNYHYLEKDGEVHESGARQKGESSGECFGVPLRCTHTFHIHYANGKLQFHRHDLNCSDPAD